MSSSFLVAFEGRKTKKFPFSKIVQALRAMASVVRVQVCENGKHQNVKVLMVNRASFQGLLKDASNKLRIKAKRIFNKDGDELFAEDLTSTEKVRPITYFFCFFISVAKFPRNLRCVVFGGFGEQSTRVLIILYVLMMVKPGYGKYASRSIVRSRLCWLHQEQSSKTKGN
jgi:hypothetical protein